MAYDRRISLFRSTAPKNEMYKKQWLSKKKIINNVIYKEECSILFPHIIIKTPEKLLQYNYLYSNDYQRYYHIKDIITLPQGQVELVCEVDVMYTYKDALGEVVVHEERATNGQSNLIVDEQVPLMHNTIIKAIHPLLMRSGDEFNFDKSNDEESLQYVMTYFSDKYYKTTDPTPITKEADETGFYWYYKTRRWIVDDNNPNDTSYTEELIAMGDTDKTNCRKIRARADKYWNDSRQWVADKEEYKTTHRGNLPYLRYVPCYSRSDVILGAAGEFARNFSYDGSIKFSPSRYDTAYKEEHEQVSGLQYTPWITDNNVPNAIKGKGLWNGWDCSEFAWRCVYFGLGVDIGSDDYFNLSGSGYKTNTADIATTMGNAYYVKAEPDPDDLTKAIFHTLSPWILINDYTELLPGDIIISGNMSTGSKDKPRANRYWVYAIRTDVVEDIRPFKQQTDLYPDSKVWKKWIFNSALRTDADPLVDPYDENFIDKPDSVIKRLDLYDLYKNHRENLMIISVNHARVCTGHKGMYDSTDVDNPISNTSNIGSIKVIPPTGLEGGILGEPRYNQWTDNGNYKALVYRPSILKYAVANGYRPSNATEA